jgi:hypothetical protein
LTRGHYFTHRTLGELVTRMNSDCGCRVRQAHQKPHIYNPHTTPAATCILRWLGIPRWVTAGPPPRSRRRRPGDYASLTRCRNRQKRLDHPRTNRPPFHRPTTKKEKRFCLPSLSLCWPSDAMSCLGRMLADTGRVSTLTYRRSAGRDGATRSRLSGGGELSG